MRPPAKRINGESCFAGSNPALSARFDGVPPVLPGVLNDQHRGNDMGFLSWIKKVIDRIVWVPTDPGPKHLKMTDAEYFIAVLNACPDGSKLYLEECEVDSWVEELRPWSFRKNPDIYEAEYYVVNAEFKRKIKELIDNNPIDLDPCHEIFITSPEGDEVFYSVDNFWQVELSDRVKEALGIKTE